MEDTYCHKCEEIFEENDIIGICDNCSLSFHNSCIGVTKSAIQARANSKFLRLYCSDCCNCPDEINAENIKTILRFVMKLDLYNQENNIKQQQNDILIRNMADKLNELDAKFGFINNGILKIDKNMKNNPVSKPNTQPKAVKNSIVKPVVLIKPKSKQISKKTFDDIKNNLNNDIFNICDTRNIKNGGLILRCNTSVDTMKIKEAVKQKFGDSYDVDLPKIKKPRLRITNIDNDIHKEAIIDELKRHNKQIQAFDFDFITAIEKTKRGFKSLDVIVEVNGSTHEKLLDIGVLHLPWRECKIYNHIYIKRCYKCCGFRHTSKICTKSQICSKCSMTHRFSECKNNKIECINCKNANKNFNANLPINHNAWSKDCLVLQRNISSLRNKIEYTQE